MNLTPQEINELIRSKAKTIADGVIDYSRDDHSPNKKRLIDIIERMLDLAKNLP